MRVLADAGEGKEVVGLAFVAAVESTAASEPGVPCAQVASLSHDPKISSDPK